MQTAMKRVQLQAFVFPALNVSVLLTEDVNLIELDRKGPVSEGELLI